MLIDCDACGVRGPACGDCVVTVLLGGAPATAPAAHHRHPVGGAADGPGGEPAGAAGPELDDAERAALAVLARHGLVPALHRVVGPEGPRLEPAPGTVIEIVVEPREPDRPGDSPPHRMPERTIRIGPAGRRRGGSTVRPAARTVADASDRERDVS